MQDLKKDRELRLDGFTIIELLCVLAIIFFLVALLMPSLQRTRKMSTRIVCSSYMRQYSVVGQVYLKDNDGVFPDSKQWLYSSSSDSKAHPIGCRWHDQSYALDGRTMRSQGDYRGQMWDYVSEMNVTCPSFRRFARLRGCENISHNRGIDIVPQNSYSMNGYLGPSPIGGVSKESEIRDSASVFFFAEENSWSLSPDHPEFPTKWLTAPLSTKALDDTSLLITQTPDARDCFATYHNASESDLSRGFANVSFVDGHVDMISVEDQLRKKMHVGNSQFGPAGNLFLAWASQVPPPGGWEGQ